VYDVSTSAADHHGLEQVSIINWNECPPSIGTGVHFHRNTHSVDQFLTSSGFDTSTQEAFEAIPDDEWDQYVRSVSDFPNWQPMLEEAASEWVVSQLGLD
jgi:hypothetical protein